MSTNAVIVERVPVLTRCYWLEGVVRSTHFLWNQLIRRYRLDDESFIRVGENGRELHRLPLPGIDLDREYWHGLDRRGESAVGRVICLVGGRLSIVSKLLGEGRCLVPSGLRWPVGPDLGTVFDPKPHLLVLGGPVDDRSLRPLRHEQAVEIDSSLGSILNRANGGTVGHQVVRVERGDNFGVYVWFPHKYFLEEDRPIGRRLVPCVVGIDSSLRA